MTKVKVTARHIKILDEISRDRKANKATLEIALQYHANLESTLRESENKLWEELAELYGLSLADTLYEIKTMDGAVYIVEKVDKDEGDF